MPRTASPIPAQSHWCSTSSSGHRGPGAEGAEVLRRVASGDFQDLIHRPDDLLHLVEALQGDLGGDPALVADVDERLADGGPVDLALTQGIVEPVGLGVFLDVNLEDSLAELADPLL